jgi:endonuclease-8
MPAGPSIIILKEAVQAFKDKKIIEVSDHSKIDYHQLQNKTVTDFKGWGKHFLICCKRITLRIHFMLFGSYRVNELYNPKVKSQKNKSNFLLFTFKF